jgi:NAD(P)-dependent dehydrogenase (short-subunit alcohol dehydrogenase family)
MDVTDEAAAANAVMAAVDVFGSLDVVINNAGYGNLSPSKTHLYRNSGQRSKRTSLERLL